MPKWLGSNRELELKATVDIIDGIPPNQFCKKAAWVHWRLGMVSVISFCWEKSDVEDKGPRAKISLLGKAVSNGEIEKS